jgi:hypothetical protein
LCLPSVCGASLRCLTGSHVEGEFVKTPAQSPRANRCAERFVGTLRRVHGPCAGPRRAAPPQRRGRVGRRPSGHRPHQGLQQEPLLGSPATLWMSPARIAGRQVLGGLISEYHRAASERETPGQHLWASMAARSFRSPHINFAADMVMHFQKPRSLCISFTAVATCQGEHKAGDL